MNRIDYLGLDGHALRLLLTVIETGSVTAAAEKLELTQSAVSHSLQRLRGILRDPLFVKSGRGIIPTAHALALAGRAQGLLDGLQDFARGAAFVPAEAELSLTIAANDLQRDLLLPGLYRSLAVALRHVTLRAIPSERPGPEILRERRCDLLITPNPPAADDLMQKRLLKDRYVCYYDPQARRAPKDMAAWLAARHVTVVYADNERLQFDRDLAAAGIRRDVAVSVPSFSGVAAFLRGSSMLATLPGLLRGQSMRDFSSIPLPLPPGLRRAGELPMYMVWHRRSHADPAGIWLRGLVEQVAAAVQRAV
jgi:DNA-binding transcriptional LysR family regulator